MCSVFPNFTKSRAIFFNMKVGTAMPRTAFTYIRECHDQFLNRDCSMDLLPVYD